jgi:predicted HicB family RNase H-like nuclease
MGMSKKEPTRMGRPPFPEGKAKSEQIVFRAEPGLCEQIRAAAKREGKGLATWIRDTLAQLLKGE